MKKKVKDSTKLMLEKTTISHLDENQLSSLKGGIAPTECCPSAITTTTPKTFTCPPKLG